MASCATVRAVKRVQSYFGEGILSLAVGPWIIPPGRTE